MLVQLHLALLLLLLVLFLLLLPMSLPRLFLLFVQVSVLFVYSIIVLPENKVILWLITMSVKYIIFMCLQVHIP